MLATANSSGSRRSTASPGLDPQRAADALDFHRTIRGRSRSTRTIPSTAITATRSSRSPGSSSPPPSRRGSRAASSTLRTYEGHDEGGDGTVPSVSATPIELSNKDLEIYVRERHASLQNADHSLDQVIGLMRRQQIDQTQPFAPGTGISLDLDDAFLATEPIAVRAQPEAEWATLSVEIQDAGSGAQVAAAALQAADDGWQQADLAPLPVGTYRATVSAGGDVNPVTDVFTVVGEGVDLEL